MEIVIHGNKNGFRTLFQTSNEEQFKRISYDFRPSSNDKNYLGKLLYDLRYLSNGFVFTKYIIIEDTLRSFSTGRLAFSVFVDKSNKVKGCDIVSILNDLSKEYINNQIVNNCVNKGELELIREDFDFVNNLKHEYQAKETTNSQTVDLQAGLKEPAFIYYDSEAKMAEYFDKPYQEEYLEHKLIIFLEEKWKDNPAENPISILPNCGKDLTNIVKLDNEYYYLKNFNQSNGIKINANGNLRSNNQGSNSIRKYDHIKILYVKDVDCFKPIDPEGTLFSDQIQKYLRIDGNSVFIISEAFVNPTPIEKEFEIKVWTRKNKKLEGVQIQIGMQPAVTMNSENFTFKVKGDDLRFHVKIYAKKDEYSGEITLNPLTSPRERELILNESHTLKITVHANSIDGHVLKNITFRVDGVLQNRDISELTFIGEETDNEHIIEISLSDFSTESIKYTPQVPFKSLKTFLKKKEVKLHDNFIDSRSKQYKIEAGEYGKKTEYCPSHSNSASGKDIDLNFHIKIKKGWEFDGWKLSQDKNTIIAQYKKKTPIYRKPKFIAACAIGIIVLAVGGWFIFRDSNNNEPVITEQRINEYLAGDSLLLYDLNRFESYWKSQEPEILDRRKWLEKISSNLGLGNYPKQLDSTDYKSWNDFSNLIDNKVVLRQAIDNLEFQNLKANHLNEISKLKKIIEKIDSTKYQELKDSILTRRQNNPDLSQLPIYEVFELIKNAYATLKNQHSSNNPSQDNPAVVAANNEKVNVAVPPPVEPKPKVGSTSNATANKNANAAETKQAKFEKEFWGLVNSGDTNRDNYKSLYNKNKSQNGKVILYLKKIADNPDMFEKFKTIKGIDRTNATKIADLENKSK